MNTPNESVTDDSVLWTIPRPDWKQWDKKHTAKLWQSVALLCNLEPSRLESRHNPGKLETLFIETPQLFRSILEQAKTGISAALLKTEKLNVEHLEESEVDLVVFSSWANGKNPFPEEYPWQPEMNIQITGWPWGRHDTKLLQMLARAADRFWKNYDSSDPTSAPTNEQVIGWLVNEKVAKRTAQVIATILRADHLPTGPRK